MLLTLEQLKLLQGLELVISVQLLAERRALKLSMDFLTHWLHQPGAKE